MSEQLALGLVGGKRRVIVGFSGGVTSAWCLGWALCTYPRDEVIALFHDTKEEHQEEFGHTINRGGNPISLRDLLQLGIKRPFDIREKIELGACECGD